MKYQRKICMCGENISKFYYFHRAVILQDSFLFSTFSQNSMNWINYQSCITIETNIFDIILVSLRILLVPYAKMRASYSMFQCHLYFMRCYIIFQRRSSLTARASKFFSRCYFCLRIYFPSTTTIFSSCQQSMLPLLFPYIYIFLKKSLYRIK